ncbi:MAG: hypothetical protein JWP81_5174 [Ferruginibacter sp.]|nr:hypothetical protein [Ferruginibacter sp.]
MKHILHYLLLFISIALLPQRSHCQSTSEWTKQKYLDRFYLELTHPGTLSPSRDRITIQCLQFFREENVYPTDDAVELMFQLNKPALLNWQGRSETDSITKFQLPEAPGERYIKRQKMFETESKPDRKSNILFFKSTRVFTRVYDSLKSMPQNTLRYPPELDTVKKRILPLISFRSFRISKIQMDYFENTVQELIGLLRTILKNNALREENTDAIIDICANLYVIDDIVKENVQRKSATTNSSAYQKDIFFANYTLRNDDNAPSESNLDLPANADIYVYIDTLYSNGSLRSSTLPAEATFNIFYGSNGLRYSLTPNCDTLSFFANHPVDLASTLPIILAKGSYCFVLQDTKTKKLYFRPNVNLANNKVYDVRKIVKLPFRIEVAQSALKNNR